AADPVTAAGTAPFDAEGILQAAAECRIRPVRESVERLFLRRVERASQSDHTHTRPDLVDKVRPGAPR
ncbi:hypothetical protein, partial [Streptomyces sp. C1-2]|uniref:hypothetical protein n=1 Tax=Streptomyces sp. C1-2 TaxID=2720022 RepID=UPI0019D282F3